jgi:hypothetical protein
MDPKSKEEHEGKYEDSKKERKNPEQPVIIPRIIRIQSWFEPNRSNQPEEMEVVMKNSVCNKM